MFLRSSAFVEVDEGRLNLREHRPVERETCTYYGESKRLPSVRMSPLPPLIVTPIMMLLLRLIFAFFSVGCSRRRPVGLTGTSTHWATDLHLLWRVQRANVHQDAPPPPHHPPPYLDSKKGVVVVVGYFWVARCLLSRRRPAELAGTSTHRATDLHLLW